jgi:MerR family mercuric resistance operon transcriptional regulator
MLIGELAERAGVPVQTIRYYERRGLIEEPPRRSGGFREFSPDYVDRICFIKRAQELGFTLSEIEDLLALRVDPGTTCAEIKAEAQEKLKGVEEKIEDLQQIHSALTRLIDRCHGQGPTSECPILDAMKEGSGEKSD